MEDFSTIFITVILLSVILGGGSAEVVEFDVKPLVDGLVDLVILVAESLGRDAFLEGLRME